MAPKCTPKKRTKNIMSLADKLSIINALQGGEKVAYLARKYNVNESTIRSIRDNQKKIEESAANVGIYSKVCKISRDSNLEKMEEMLIMYIQDMNKKKSLEYSCYTSASNKILRICKCEFALLCKHCRKF